MGVLDKMLIEAKRLDDEQLIKACKELGKSEQIMLINEARLIIMDIDRRAKACANCKSISISEFSSSLSSSFFFFI